MKDAHRGSIDATEVAKFEAIAAEWWDPDGKFKPLHAMNPCRLDYILDQASAEFGRDPTKRRALAGLKVADIGCGGGLLAEPLARMGADVTGVDAAEGNIATAAAHAAQMGLAIDYRATTAEALAASGAQFDLVTALEIVEHVADIPTFLQGLSDLLRPGGMVVISTLNRTAQSWATAIVGAELVLRWLPRGTHDWSKFPTPVELETALEGAGLEVVDLAGMRLDIPRGEWRVDPQDTSINYILTALKPGG